MELDGKNITQYRTMTNIYFDIEEETAKRRRRSGGSATCVGPCARF